MDILRQKNKARDNETLYLSQQYPVLFPRSKFRK